MATSYGVPMECANGHKWTGPSDLIGTACPGPQKRDDCDAILQRATWSRPLPAIDQLQEW